MARNLKGKERKETPREKRLRKQAMENIGGQMQWAGTVVGAVVLAVVLAVIWKASQN
eukprot:m.260278 g.260278  ORF g.260278 m.260278 type:complete len:57 (-) comp39601_c0_seq1:425-595(-)